jgi:hypothetical protein
MQNRQLTLLNHATQLSKEQSVPYSVDTETAAKLLRVSTSTLNRAKNTSRLPCTRTIQGVCARADFIEYKNGKDWWQVYFKTLEDYNLG